MRPGRAAVPGAEVDPRRVDVHVTHRGVHDEGRIHLEHAARHQARPRSARPPLLTGAHVRRASVCPTRTGVPGPRPGCQAAAPGGRSRMTVEPMLKRPISSALARLAVAALRIASRARRRGLRGVTSPCHTVAMLPTNSAPTSTRAKVSGPSSNTHTTRSLRANSEGTLAAVVAFTLNSAPGTYQAARSVPGRGMWMRW